LLDAMRDGELDGMEHVDGAIEKLVRQRIISLATGLLYATNARSDTTIQGLRDSLARGWAWCAVDNPRRRTWRRFLGSHIGRVMAADFFVVPTATCRLLFVLVILAHERRAFGSPASTTRHCGQATQTPPITKSSFSEPTGAAAAARYRLLFDTKS
jgi:hypothetical protein